MWFRVDDTFLGHPKAVGLSNDALATWTRAGDWCAWQLTDGVFERDQLAEFAGDADDPDAVAAELLRRRLWEPGADDGQVQFHDWGDWNPTRAQVLAKRKADTERRRRWLASRRDPATGRAASDHDVNHGVTPDHGVSNAVTDPDHDVNHGVMGPDHGVDHTSPTRPDPTRRGGVGEGSQGADRNAPEGWTPHSALDAPPPSPAKRGGGAARRQPPPAAKVLPGAARPGGPSADVAVRAAEARALLAARTNPAPLEAADAELPDW